MKIENDLGRDDICQLVLRLAIPSMLAQFINVLYSVVDRIYIGNIPVIGETALAGVGVSGPIVTLISAFAYLVGLGGSPLMSIRMGEGQDEKANCSIFPSSSSKRFWNTSVTLSFASESILRLLADISMGLYVKVLIVPSAFQDLTYISDRSCFGKNAADPSIGTQSAVTLSTD